MGESSSSSFHINGPAQQNRQYLPVPTAATMSSASSPLYQNPEIQRALLNARMSRRRKSTTAATSHTDNTQLRTTSQDPLSFSRSFSFEEYDPRMPRPPSPTSLAIAQATGQWSNGTPFVHDSANMNMNTVPMTMATSYRSPAPASGGLHPTYHQVHPNAVDPAAYAYAGVVPGVVPHMSSHSQLVTPVPYQTLPPNTGTSTSFESDDAQMKDWFAFRASFFFKSILLVYLKYGKIRICFLAYLINYIRLYSIELQNVNWIIAAHCNTLKVCICETLTNRQSQVVMINEYTTTATLTVPHPFIEAHT